MKYSYSQVTGISIKDFRNLGNVDIDFTKSPILCLKGGNEAGKSSVVLALKTLGSNLSSKQYKEYIRTGTDGWTVMLYTNDGKVVYRKKTATKQVYGILALINNKYEPVWSIDKLDENAVPAEVQEILGFTVEPETKELLNVRTYKDQMLFVDTSGGSNYKVMYNALKIDNITRAVKLGTTEAKQYRQEVESCENSVATCKEQLRKIRTIDTEALTKMKNRIKKEREVIVLLEKTMALKESLDKTVKTLGVLNDIGSLNTIDEYLFTTINNAFVAKNQISQIENTSKTLEDIRGLELIDTTVIEKFSNAFSVKDNLEKLNMNVYSDIDKCGLIDTMLYSKLESVLSARDKYNNAVLNLSVYEKGEPGEISERLYKMFDDAYEKRNHIVQLDTEYNQVKAVVNQFYAQLKQMGIVYSICPNCGEIVFDGEGHTE